MATGNQYPELYCWKRVDGGVQQCLEGEDFGPVVNDANFIQYLVDTKQIDPEE